MHYVYIHHICITYIMHILYTHCMSISNMRVYQIWVYLMQLLYTKSIDADMWCKAYLWPYKNCIFRLTYFMLSYSRPISAEKRLVRDLLDRYRGMGREGRPVTNISQPVNVLFGLGLIKMELYEKENMLSLSTWARYVSYFFYIFCLIWLF